MIKKSLKRISDLLTLKKYRQTVLANQQKQLAETRKLYEQVFLNNPVLAIGSIKINLPLFHVDHIQKIIFATGDFYEKETLQYLKTTFGSFDTIIDIGSNIGNHMLYYCSELHAKKVICFEPNTHNHQALCDNVALNNLQQIVTVHRVAVGEKEGKGVEKDFSLANTGMNRIEAAQVADDSMSVDIKRLDDFSFTGISFIKIDVEGFEMEVLKGAAKTITNSKAVVMIEVFHENRQQVDSLMQSYGYKMLTAIEEFNLIYVAG